MTEMGGATWVDSVAEELNQAQVSRQQQQRREEVARSLTSLTAIVVGIIGVGVGTSFMFGWEAGLAISSAMSYVLGILIGLFG